MTLVFTRTLLLFPCSPHRWCC